MHNRRHNVGNTLHCGDNDEWIIIAVQGAHKSVGLVNEVTSYACPHPQPPDPEPVGIVEVQLIG